MTMLGHSSEEDDIPMLIPIANKKRKIEDDGFAESNSNEEEGENNVVEQKKTKLTKLSSKKVKPPTSDELTRLRETENLFHSNMFRLQIEEILKEIKPKETLLAKAKVWIESISDFIKKIDSCEEIHKLNDNSWLQKAKIHIPLIQDPKHDKGSFQFIQPSAVYTVGSFGTKCMMGPKINIDLAVEMPKKMILTGDHLNEKYFRKKIIYLCHIAHQLNKSKAELNIGSVQYKLINNHPYSISLLVTPTPEVSKKISLNILAIPQAKSFKLSKLNPNLNNVRESWLCGEEKDEEDNRHLKPTPYYNTMLARDVVLAENNQFRNKLFEQHEALADAYLLLCVWLHQRELDHDLGSISCWTLSMYLAHLFSQKKLNSHMSSYQIVRNVWIHLSQSTWDTEGISLNSGANLADYKTHFPIVFIDVTGLCNITASLSLNMYGLIKEQSKAALSCLDDFHLDSFRLLFMTPAPFMRQFDHYVCFNKFSEMKKVVESNAPDDMLDRGNLCVTQFTNLIVSYLKKAIGLRISQVAIQFKPHQKICELGDTFVLEDDQLVIGLKLDTSTCYNVIHKGPEANLPEALEFRKIWGSKSELRRFKDGTVCEATVWGAGSDSFAKKRSITKEIILYLLKSKFDLEDVVYISDQLDQKLISLQKGIPSSTGEEASGKAISVFDELSRTIRDLKDLPLDVSSVYPSSSTLRYTNPLPPVPQTHKDLNLKIHNHCFVMEESSKVPPLVEPIEAVIHFISTSKWPNDLNAIYRLKAAFYIDLSHKIWSQHHLACKVSTNFLDVYKAGLVFRFKLYCPTEITLLKKHIANGVELYRSTQQSLLLEQQLLHLPTLHGSLHGLHQQHSVFGPTCCLAKRWLNSQLFDDHYWPDICVELLVASLITTPQPFTFSMQPQVMFIRFLQLLTEHNFQTDPVLINLNKELSRDDIVHIETIMRSDRKSLPPLVLVTPFDASGVKWTKSAPTVTTLVRTVKLAMACLSILENNLRENLSLDTIFTFPKEDFDVIISLNKSGVSILKPVDNPEDVENDDTNIMPVVNFNPVSYYIKTLREAYGEMALFFWDQYGGLEIGVVYKPDVLVDSKSMKFNSRMPKQNSFKGNLEFVNNTKAMLEDFYILGRGLVKSVTSREDGLVLSPFRMVS